LDYEINYNVLRRDSTKKNKKLRREGLKDMALKQSMQDALHATH